MTTTQDTAQSDNPEGLLVLKEGNEPVGTDVGLVLSDTIWHGNTNEEDSQLRGHVRHQLTEAARQLSSRPHSKFHFTEVATHKGYGWRITLTEKLTQNEQRQPSGTASAPEEQEDAVTQTDPTPQDSQTESTRTRWTMHCNGRWNRMRHEKQKRD